MLNAEKWMSKAKAYIGVKEIPGADDDPDIEYFLSTTDYDLPEDHVDEIPWCSAFANAVLKEAGYKGTNSAWSQSWIEWGHGLPGPAYGALVVFSWGNGHGHVGFVFDWDSSGIYVLGGNQANAVNVTKFSYNKVRAYRYPNFI